MIATHGDSILSIETSSELGSVAVSRDGECVFEESFKADRSHNSLLFSPLAAALEACGGSPAWIVTGRGPGSYAGVRVAMAAAQGVSLSTGAGVFGLPSICALEADGEAPDSYFAIGNARRGDWFLARVDDGRLARPPRLVREADLVESLEILRVEDAAPPEVLTIDPDPPVAEAARAFPGAGKLARLAGGYPVDELGELALHPLEPIYLHRPFVSQPKG